MIEYSYQIIYKGEPNRQTGNVKNSPFFKDEFQATSLFDKTHRTASLWRTWKDDIKGERWELLRFKVVYSEQELNAMHPNLLRTKYNELKDKMTDATIKRLEAVAKRKNITI